MTDKRLIVDENYNLVDTVTGEWLDDTQVFDLANKLHEENQELKRLIKKMGELGGFNKHMIKTIYEGLE